MPFAVAYCTVMVFPLTAERLTVKLALLVPLFPSVTLTSLIAIVGTGSSLVIVSCPWLSAIVALVGVLRLITKVSSGSLSASPQTVIGSVWLVCPALKVSVPLHQGGWRASRSRQYHPFTYAVIKQT